MFSFYLPSGLDMRLYCGFFFLEFSSFNTYRVGPGQVPRSGSARVAFFFLKRFERLR